MAGRCGLSALVTRSVTVKGNQRTRTPSQPPAALLAVLAARRHRVATSARVAGASFGAETENGT
jgi:hypothetical protein